MLAIYINIIKYSFPQVHNLLLYHNEVGLVCSYDVAGITYVTTVTLILILGIRYSTRSVRFASDPHVVYPSTDLLDCFSHPKLYEVCPESIQPFWISREPVAWPWCNLAASQRRPYCTSVNSQSPVGLVSRQWDAVDWDCVLCDRRIHNDRASRSASPRQDACPL